MSNDIEPIIQVLSNYMQHLVLREDELTLLRSWIMESEANEILFDDISNKANRHFTNWIIGRISVCLFIVLFTWQASLFDKTSCIGIQGHF